MWSSLLGFALIALMGGPYAATSAPLLDSLACVHRQVNDAKDKWSVHAGPTLTFDVCAFLKETNLTTCPESLVSNRLAMKLGWYAIFVCGRREAGQVLVCKGVEHGTGNCSDYHRKRLAYEESILYKCSNKQLDGSDGTPLNNETIAVLKDIHALETLQFEQQHKL